MSEQFFSHCWFRVCCMGGGGGGGHAYVDMRATEVRAEIQVHMYRRILEDSEIKCGMSSTT